MTSFGNGSRGKRDKRRPYLLGFLAVLTAGLLAGCDASPVVESSGLARSSSGTTLFWTHNDGSNTISEESGDTHLYLLGPGNRLVSKTRVGTANRDWEDLATFEMEGRRYLLIADVGDNDEKRNIYRLVVVGEPINQAEVSIEWIVEFRYPDGPHDCEAVAVIPDTHSVLLVSKRDRPAGIYRLPLAPHPGVAIAEKVGDFAALPAPTWKDTLRNPLQGPYSDQPTGLDISPDGRFVAVLTYRNAYVWARPEGQKWPEVFTEVPTVLELPELRQWEGIAWSPEGEALHISREGTAELLRIEWAKAGRK